MVACSRRYCRSGAGGTACRSARRRYIGQVRQRLMIGPETETDALAASTDRSATGLSVRRQSMTKTVGRKASRAQLPTRPDGVWSFKSWKTPDSVRVYEINPDIDLVESFLMSALLNPSRLPWKRPEMGVDLTKAVLGRCFDVRGEER